MLIALISDTHGNLPALESVLKDIRAQGADQIIFLGDAATLGPQPREMLDILRGLDCVCIMGNHDAALLDPARAADYQISERLVPALHWGRELLREADLDFLRTFRPMYELETCGAQNLLCFHGSPRSNTRLDPVHLIGRDRGQFLQRPACKNSDWRAYPHPNVSTARTASYHQSRKRGDRVPRTLPAGWRNAHAFAVG